MALSKQTISNKMEITYSDWAKSLESISAVDVPLKTCAKGKIREKPRSMGF
jgi:hypothetical protein